MKGKKKPTLIVIGLVILSVGILLSFHSFGFLSIFPSNTGYFYQCSEGNHEINDCTGKQTEFPAQKGGGDVTLVVEEDAFFPRLSHKYNFFNRLYLRWLNEKYGITATIGCNDYSYAINLCEDTLDTNEKQTLENLGFTRYCDQQFVCDDTLCLTDPSWKNTANSCRNMGENLCNDNQQCTGGGTWVVRPECCNCHYEDISTTCVYAKTNPVQEEAMNDILTNAKCTFNGGKVYD